MHSSFSGPTERYHRIPNILQQNLYSDRTLFDALGALKTLYKVLLHSCLQLIRMIQALAGGCMEQIAFSLLGKDRPR